MLDRFLDDMIVFANYPDETHELNQLCSHYPMNLPYVVKIIELMVRIAEVRSPEGAVKWLEKRVKEDFGY